LEHTKPGGNETKAEMMKKYQKDLRLNKNCFSCDYKVLAVCVWVCVCVCVCKWNVGQNGTRGRKIRQKFGKRIHNNAVYQNRCSKDERTLRVCVSVYLWVCIWVILTTTTTTTFWGRSLSLSVSPGLLCQ